MITRLKAQVEETQLHIKGGVQDDKAKLESSEARVKALEKQRVDLIEGFRKQMKLIDILKRQKVQVESYLIYSYYSYECEKIYGVKYI